MRYIPTPGENGIDPLFQYPPGKDQIQQLWSYKVKEHSVLARTSPVRHIGVVLQRLLQYGVGPKITVDCCDLLHDG